jgi:hypothetical protein
MCQIGLPGTSLLQRLIRLPFQYFNTKAGRDLLFPTLAILSLEERNRMVIEEEMSLDFIQLFLKKNSSNFHPALRSALQQYFVV